MLCRPPMTSLRRGGGWPQPVPLQGRPATARPPCIRAPGCGATPARGGNQWPARKGLPPVARVVASRGSCPLAGRLSAGKDSCRLRRGGNDGAVRVREEG
ncbi:hypothetical protein BHE74_00023965 [Ensete ventricosum]|nr:hypothetical protein GW17_00059829 [Ensete ventricosum]RWW68506.1 hypothetical protein BHE74_00023965 [Ensete ventricosum]RZS17334.1 hypothetical protein BHM03_00049464 [Ensete ventricosum]